MTADRHIVGMKRFFSDIFRQRQLHHLQIGTRPLLLYLQAISPSFVGITHGRMCFIPVVIGIGMIMIGIGLIAQFSKHMTKTKSHIMTNHAAKTVKTIR